MLLFTSLRRLRTDDGNSYYTVETVTEDGASYRPSFRHFLYFLEMEGASIKGIRAETLINIKEICRNSSSSNLYFMAESTSYSDAEVRLLLEHFVDFAAHAYVHRYTPYYKTEVVQVLNDVTRTYSDITAAETAKEISKFVNKLSSRYHTIESDLQQEYSTRLANAKSGAFVEMFNSVATLVNQGWRLDNHVSGLNKGPTLVYDKGIVPNKVHVSLEIITKRPIDQGVYVTLPLPEKYTKDMHLDILAVPVGSRTITSAYGRGYHPHLSGGGSTSTWTSLCIGDNKGKPFDLISEFVQNLKTVNYMSMFGGDSSRVTDNYISHCRDQYAKTGKVPGLDLKTVAQGGTLFHVGTSFSDVLTEIEDVDEEEGTW